MVLVEEELTPLRPVLEEELTLGLVLAPHRHRLLADERAQGLELLWQGLDVGDVQGVVDGLDDRQDRLQALLQGELGAPVR